MRYHNITTDDMLNGEGLRTVLWVAGCTHKCPGCQNPITWDPYGGVPFDIYAEAELYSKLYPEHISGVTFSGGDPLHPVNRFEILRLAKEIKESMPNKTIWLYTGYTWEYIVLYFPAILPQLDVVVDGRFIERLKDVNYPWAGSTNQRVIDVRKTLEKNGGGVVLWEGQKDVGHEEWNSHRSERKRLLLERYRTER